MTSHPRGESLTPFGGPAAAGSRRIRGVTNIVEREVLLAPDVIARAAAAIADRPEQRWMLSQPRDVRRSYVRDVIGQGDEDAAQRRWMLRAPEAVRESYIEVVHSAEPDGPRPEVLWMLRQPDSVRESYIDQVLDADEGEYRPDVVWMLRLPDEARESYIESVLRPPDGE